jgi:hypothetical protein
VQKLQSGQLKAYKWSYSGRKVRRWVIVLTMKLDIFESLGEKSSTQKLSLDHSAGDKPWHRIDSEDATEGAELRSHG